MKKLSVMLKKLVDQDTQDLVKAGYLDGELNITHMGERALITHLFFAHKSDLVALAKADIEEVEKEEAKK